MTNDDVKSLGSLQKLIDELRNLYQRVSSVWLEQRLERGANGGGDASDLTLAKQLYDHIDTYPADTIPETVSSTVSNDPAGSDEIPPARTVGANPPATETPLTANDLSDWISHAARESVSERHIADKLEATARSHINSALRLARQGKKQEAKIHADLAENAVKTAADYMSAESFQSFKTFLQERLRSLKSLD